MMIAATGIPMVENILAFMGYQKLGVNDLRSVNILFILEMDACFIFGILLARAFSPLSVRISIFRDCIQLKLFIFEYDLLKPNLYSGVSIMASTFIFVLDGRTKLIGLALHPLGRLIISYGKWSLIE